MFETRKITWSKDWALSEIYSGGLQMAMASPADADGVHSKATTFVTCKDFFQDAIRAMHIGKGQAIYGFRYTPGADPAISLDRARILVGNNTDPTFADKIVHVLDFLNQFERRIHVIRTRAFHCDPTPDKWKNSGGVFLFEGSGRWLIAPPMLSLYTLLIRCGFSHEKGKDFDDTCKGIIAGKIATIGDGNNRQSGCYDAGYLRDSQFGIKAILEHGYAKIFYKNPASNYPESIPIGTLHNSSGIVGFSKKYMKEHMPYWYKHLEPVKKRKKKATAS
jgi:hypothetical protein